MSNGHFCDEISLTLPALSLMDICSNRGCRTKQLPSQNSSYTIFLQFSIECNDPQGICEAAFCNVWLFQLFTLNSSLFTGATRLANYALLAQSMDFRLR